MYLSKPLSNLMPLLIVVLSLLATSQGLVLELPGLYIGILGFTQTKSTYGVRHLLHTITQEAIFSLSPGDTHS